MIFSLFFSDSQSLLSGIFFSLNSCFLFSFNPQFLFSLELLSLNLGFSFGFGSSDSLSFLLLHDLLLLRGQLFRLENPSNWLEKILDSSTNKIEGIRDVSCESVKSLINLIAVLIHRLIDLVLDFEKSIHNFFKLDVNVGDDFPEFREVLLKDLLECKVFSLLELMNCSLDSIFLNVLRHIYLIELVVETRKVGK